MNYMTLKEASEQWGISVRRINLLCTEGRIGGAVKKQNLWMIPSDAQKPADGRKKKEPLKEPFVLFGNATYAENRPPQDLCQYDEIICKSQLLFMESRFDECIAKIHKLEKICTDKQYLLVACTILRFASTLSANETEQKTAIKKINKLLNDPGVGELTKALTRISDPNNAIPDQIFFYTDKKIMKELTPFLSLQSLMRNIVSALKGSHMHVLISAEIICRTLRDSACTQFYVYYNICMSVYYYFIGFNQYAEPHFREALTIALPRKWYTPFVQYFIFLDLDVIMTLDLQAYLKIRQLSNQMLKNYTELNILSNDFNRSFANDLLSLQIAYQVASGKTNAEIAEHFGISVYLVKKKISEIYLRTGYTTRAEIKDYILSHIFL